MNFHPCRAISYKPVFHRPILQLSNKIAPLPPLFHAYVLFSLWPQPKIIRKEPAPPPPAAESKSEPNPTHSTQHSDNGADAPSQNRREFDDDQAPLGRWEREEEEGAEPREEWTAGNRKASGRGEEQDVGDHRRRCVAQDGGRRGDSGPTRAPSPQDNVSTYCGF